MERIRLLHVATTQGYAGVLLKDGQHQFSYDPSIAVPSADQARAISLTMPVRAAPWRTTPMLPAFQTSLPEGFLSDRIRERFGKLFKMDDMAMLALSGGNAIGRLRVSTTREASAAPPAAAESLKEILADQGSRDLFEYLCDKYLISTSIAGVQPKVVVPVEGNRGAAISVRGASAKASIGERSTLRARQLIVKVDSGDYPHIAENEYHCLAIAKRCADLFRVPPFSLSQDRRRLAVERFDLGADGYLGFEDMVSLQGRVNDGKYDGSYELIAQTIRDNCSPLRLQDSLARFFASVVLAVAVRNGDAHLKNFGLLYTSPVTDDCELSPLFDQVCTTLYLPKDIMALNLGRSRSWPVRAALVKFGAETCHVKKPAQIIDQIVDATLTYRPAMNGPGWKELRPILHAAAASIDRDKISPIRKQPGA